MREATYRVRFLGGPWHDRELVLPDLRSWKVLHKSGEYLYAYRGLQRGDDWIYELDSYDATLWQERSPETR